MLAATPPAEAMASLRQIKGLGPVYAMLVYLRATGVKDAAALGEPRLASYLRHYYGLAATPDTEEVEALAEAWRPFRTWASVLFRVAGDRDGLPFDDPAPRRTVTGRRAAGRTLCPSLIGFRSLWWTRRSMFCWNCGAELHGDPARCPDCGAWPGTATEEPDGRGAPAAVFGHVLIAGLTVITVGVLVAIGLHRDVATYDRVVTMPWSASVLRSLSGSGGRASTPRATAGRSGGRAAGPSGAGSSQS